MSWAGRIFLGEGWMIYAGPVGPTTWHRHHAFQLVCSLERALILRGRADAVGESCHVAAIPNDVDHKFESGCPSTILGYVDPETLWGRRLRRTVIASARADAWRTSGGPLVDLSKIDPPRTWPAAAAVRDQMIDRVTGEAVRPVPLHPALLAARRWLVSQVDGGDVSLGGAAAAAYLSESRLSHLLAEQLGLGWRPLVLWLRLQRAAAELGAGHSLAAAASAAGFADGAHLTRTFRRMFGLAPSEVSDVATFVRAPEE
jgi:AraC-like DNA-binding protein